MGDFRVKAIANDQERVSFYNNMIADIQAFRIMLKEGIVEKRGDHIGAEQELCIVNDSGDPSPKALEILDALQERQYTNELALFNLEINLDPQKLVNRCFSKTERELDDLIRKGRKKADWYDSNLYLGGILPSIKFRNLFFDFMTPEERYKLLSRELLRLRGSDFEIYLQGVDDLNVTLDSVLFEACNTSFQLHLQVNPDNFVRMHNWAQMISGPVLSACTNSPLLFGKELWSETRIALFKQSLDTRSRKNYSRIILPRVYFGNGWMQKSAVELWEKELIRFPVLVTGQGDENPLELLDKGITPSLRSIRLHNGTTYTWNRLCYGVVNNSPHIRIECRYLPSGPTIKDEIANFAFWIGLMKGLPEEKHDFWKETDFRLAKGNFIKAARNGLNTVFQWFGKSLSARALILDELLPLSVKGLQSMKIAPEDISEYLSIIEKRVESGRTGSDWMVRMNKKLRKKYKTTVASRIMVKASLEFQEENIPVHEWPDISPSFASSFAAKKEKDSVEDIMTADIISVKQNVPVRIVKKIMDWKGFNHVPVENTEGELVGIVSSSLLEKVTDSDKIMRDVMSINVITTTPSSSILEAEKLMTKHSIGCLPVVEDKKLLGLITKTDLVKCQADRFDSVTS